MEILFEKLGFQKSFFVQGRHSVADLFKPKERCGIYVLHFENGQFYVGLAVDVVRRYTQHKKNHSDIKGLFFKRVAERKLQEEEKYTAQILEKEGVRLRNIQLVSIVEGETDFDLIMAVDEQDRFCKDPDYNSFEGTKFEIEEQRIKYSKSFEMLKGLPCFEDFIASATKYAEIGIPMPFKSEYSFWCISCLGGRFPISRVNINWQEVCTFLLDKEGFDVTFHLAKSPLTEVFGSSLEDLFRKVPSLELMLADDGLPHTYEPGGQDQISFILAGCDFEKFVEIRAVKTAIRLFNLRLMRKGATVFNRYHSFDLSKTVLESLTSRIPARPSTSSKT